MKLTKTLAKEESAGSEQRENRSFIDHIASAVDTIPAKLAIVRNMP